MADAAQSVGNQFRGHNGNHSYDELSNSASLLAAFTNPSSQHNQSLNLGAWLNVVGQSRPLVPNKICTLSADYYEFRNVEAWEALKKRIREQLNMVLFTFSGTLIWSFLLKNLRYLTQIVILKIQFISFNQGHRDDDDDDDNRAACED
ncbi:hypothetical protein MP228_005681 [Amoeboaphelidium protococcarum]|nr:hypothetical protein MP228_005681 [Amoeboaphelidium protococcarum]